jgi:hypothetical protein
MQATSFFDAMIIPMPPEMSQVSEPVLVRFGACAMPGAGRPIAAATARAAKALKVLGKANSYFDKRLPNNAAPHNRFPRSAALKLQSNVG